MTSVPPGGDDRPKNDDDSVPLSELPKNKTAVITRIRAEGGKFKKFADVGFVKGQGVEVEERTLFGGLIRVNVMNTSIAMHKEDASHILVKADPAPPAPEN